jgi:murein DD-endopeptidase MepM/ murein hydrolase activator NlpD
VRFGAERSQPADDASLMRRLRSHVRLGRAVRAGFVVILAAVLLGTSVVPMSTTRAGSPLADALQSQRTLRAKIAAQQKQLKSLGASERKLAATLDATERSLNAINADLTVVRGNVKDASAALVEVRTQYQSLVKYVDELTWRLAALEDDMAQGEAELAASRRILALHIADAYRTQQTSLLEQLLSAGSLADVLADVGYYMASGDQDARLAEQIQHDQQALDQLRRTTIATRAQTQRARLQVKQKYNEMTAQRDALVRQQERLAALEETTREAQARQLAAYSAVKRNKSQTAALLTKEKAALDDLQAEIDRLLAQNRGNVPSVYNGSLAWPMAGTVTQEYGCTGVVFEPPSGGCGHFHNGIDIATGKYTPIHAAGDGIVIFAGPNPYDPPGARAWIVIIQHSDNLTTWYAHVDNAVRPPAVQRGQRVRQGDVIAYEGNTGNSTGPHLHWMVELGGRFVNPRQFV